MLKVIPLPLLLGFGGKAMKVLRTVNKICGYIAGVFVLLSAVVMLYDVISRYFFQAPSLYAPFIAAFLVLGATFIGAAYSLQAGGQVYVELLVDKMKPLARKICMTIGYIFAMIFVFFLTQACWQYASDAVKNNWHAQGNLPIPSVILYGVMVVGSVLLLLTLIQKILETWFAKAAPPPEEEEEEETA